MKQYKEYSTEDFLEDVSFIQWVINPTDESEKYWKNIRIEYPEKKEAIEGAILVIKSSQVGTKKLPEEEKKQLWEEIQNEIKSYKQNKKQYNSLVRIAAGIIILFSLGFLLYQLTNKDDEINYSAIIDSLPGLENTKLILADDSKIDIDKEESNIEYGEDGILVLDEERIVDNNKLNSRKAGEEIAMNQIIVPRGRRANISFSDGTKLWLNSGSRAVYPVAFSGSKREIYIEGEAYLEVTKEKNKPFIVKTKSMDVRVLGTSFNINAYSEEQEISVVLVEGSVEIKRANKKIKLSPNQKFGYNIVTQKTEIVEDINVLEYIGWKDGWLLCNSEALKSLFKKLEMYYDVDILVKDTIVETYKTSGKLELKENIEDVLKVISITAPIKYAVKEDLIYMYDMKSDTN